MVNIPKNSPGANDIFRQIDRADFASATGYQIIKSCGRGSYGEVFLVCDNVGRLSALKLIGISSSVNVRRSLACTVFSNVLRDAGSIFLASWERSCHDWQPYR